MRLNRFVVVALLIDAWLLPCDGAQKGPKQKPVFKSPDFVEAVFTPDVPNTIRATLDDVQQRRRDLLGTRVLTIRNLEQTLKNMERSRINPRAGVISVDQRTGMWTFPSKKLKDEEIARKRDELADAQKQAADAATNSLLVPEFARKLRPGDLGTIPDSMRVRQVISDGQFLAEAFVGGVNETIWISGVNTEDLTDDVGIKISTPLIVVGTKAYTNALGARRTVLELSPFKMEKYVLPKSE